MTTKIDEVQWSQINRVEDLPEVSEEDKAEVERRLQLLDKELNEHTAKYKLELMLNKDYSFHKPSAGALSFWMSGRTFQGGGDVKMYMCPGKHLGKNECSGFIPDTGQGLGMLVCPKCLSLWKSEQVIGEVLGRHTIQQWAELLTQYFMKLEMNADIRVKYHPSDIRSAALREQDRQMGGEVLEGSRNTRAVVVYPRANIIKDTSSGATLYGRFLALLKS